MVVSGFILDIKRRWARYTEWPLSIKQLIKAAVHTMVIKVLPFDRLRILRFENIKQLAINNLLNTLVILIQIFLLLHKIISQQLQIHQGSTPEWFINSPDYLFLVFVILNELEQPIKQIDRVSLTTLDFHFLIYFVYLVLSQLLLLISISLGFAELQKGM